MRGPHEAPRPGQLSRPRGEHRLFLPALGDGSHTSAYPTAAHTYEAQCEELTRVLRFLLLAPHPEASLAVAVDASCQRTLLVQLTADNRLLAYLNVAPLAGRDACEVRNIERLLSARSWELPRAWGLSDRSLGVMTGRLCGWQLPVGRVIEHQAASVPFARRVWEVPGQGVASELLGALAVLAGSGGDEALQLYYQAVSWGPSGDVAWADLNVARFGRTRPVPGSDRTSDWWS